MFDRFVESFIFFQRNLMIQSFPAVSLLPIYKYARIVKQRKIQAPAFANSVFQALAFTKAHHLDQLYIRIRDSLTVIVFVWINFAHIFPFFSSAYMAPTNVICGGGVTPNVQVTASSHHKSSLAPQQSCLDNIGEMTIMVHLCRWMH